MNLELSYLVKFKEGDLGGDDAIRVQITDRFYWVRAAIYDQQKQFFERHGLSPIDLDLYAPSKFAKAPRGNRSERADNIIRSLDDVDVDCTVESVFAGKELDKSMFHLLVVIRSTDTAHPRKQLRYSDPDQSRDTRPPVGVRQLGNEEPILLDKIVSSLYDFLWKKKEHWDKITDSIVTEIPALELYGSRDEDPSVDNDIHQSRPVTACFVDLEKNVPNWPDFGKSKRTFISHFLIREEYCIFDDFVEKNAEDDILLVGQPGIGKTVYLTYCLLKRLVNGRRTILALDRQRRYLFQDSGVYSMPGDSFFQETRRDIVRYDKDTLVLFDCNNEHPTPFRWHDLRVLVASSPQPKRYKDWKKDHSPKQFVMKTWEWSEIWVSRTSDIDRKLSRYGNQWRDAFLKYGGSARNLLTKRDKEIDELIASGIRNCDNLDRLFPRDADFRDTASSILVEINPRRDEETGEIDRAEWSGKIISQYIFDKLIRSKLKDASFIDSMQKKFGPFSSCDDVYNPRHV